MAAAAAMIAIDTNLLVYANRSAAPEHAGARRAIERIKDSPVNGTSPTVFGLTDDS